MGMERPENSSSAPVAAADPPGGASESLQRGLLDLTRRWNRQALTLFRGEKPGRDGYALYDGAEDLLSDASLDSVCAMPESPARQALFHAFIDHRLRRVLLPHDTEMSAWSRGAAAHVNGEKIRLKEIIPWCQKKGDFEGRRVLQKETSALCRFLKPFAENYWRVLLETLKGDFGFDSYVDYCRDKKGIDYNAWVPLVSAFLEETESLYFSAMNRWTRRRFSLPVTELTRFDAIHLLGMAEFDPLFPDADLKGLTRFFATWGIDPADTKGLTIDLSTTTVKSAQAMCFFIRVPEEVVVVMRPEGGWIDLESLWHELGHGLSAAHVSPLLDETERNLATAYSLSESYAFLLQNIATHPLFLTRFLGLHEDQARLLHAYKALRELAAFRRYAAKFLSEIRMFTDSGISDGRPYAETMARHTGYYHQPESALFDLVPELYCFDYLTGWMGEAVLEAHLSGRFGLEWMFDPAAGGQLRKWWGQGFCGGLFPFLKQNGLPEATFSLLAARWEAALPA